MPNEDEKKEYILNENGKIWCGTFKKPVGKHWIFGQFDDIVLPAAVFLMEKSGLAPADRGSPVLVSRAISAVVRTCHKMFALKLVASFTFLTID
jgi:transglutaminase 1